MKVDSVTSDAYGVQEEFGAIDPERVGNVLFEDRKFRPDTPRGADVWCLCKPIMGMPDHVTSDSQSWVPQFSIGSGRLHSAANTGSLD